MCLWVWGVRVWGSYDEGLSLGSRNLRVCFLS